MPKYKLPAAMFEVYSRHMRACDKAIDRRDRIRALQHAVSIDKLFTEAGEPRPPKLAELIAALGSEDWE